LKDLLKLAALVAAIVAASFAFVALQQKKGYGLVEGTAAPPLRLPALAGGELALDSYRGHVVLVNFWATWCPPCVEEMPSLERLHRALAAEGLVVLGVSVDDDGAALEAFVRRAGVTFPMLRDPGGRGPTAAWRTTGWPETFVLDGTGKIVRKFVGPARWDTPEAIGWFRGLLKAGAPS
jgi:cytochrome c biogenesis protein CcmG, thiol:disulfide interchange protein DsbE